MTQSQLIADMPRHEVLRHSLAFVLYKVESPSHVQHWDQVAGHLIDDLGGMAGAW